MSDLLLSSSNHSFPGGNILGKITKALEKKIHEEFCIAVIVSGDMEM